MAGENEPKKETPTLEMRLAAIEDKLARLTVSEEEMAAYTKVAGLAHGRGAASGGAASGPATRFTPAALGSWIRITDCVIWIDNPHPVVNDCILYQATQASSGVGFSRLGRG
jgi:hypothetical protein